MKIAIIGNAGAYCTNLILGLGVKMYYILFSLVLLTSLPCMSMDFNIGEVLRRAIESGGCGWGKLDNIKWVEQILEDEPAAVNIKSKNGLTPLDLALREDRLDVARLLLAKGGKASNMGPKLLEDENTTALFLPYISKENVESAEYFFQLYCQDSSPFASGNDEKCAHMQKLLSMVQAEFNKK
jgi:hypothetical protein